MHLQTKIMEIIFFSISHAEDKVILKHCHKLWVLFDKEWLKLWYFYISCRFSFWSWLSILEKRVRKYAYTFCLDLTLSVHCPYFLRQTHLAPFQRGSLVTFVLDFINPNAQLGIYRKLFRMFFMDAVPNKGYHFQMKR